MLRDIYLLRSYALASRLNAGDISDIDALRHFIVVIIMHATIPVFPVIGLNGLFADDLPVIILTIGSLFINTLIIYFGIWLTFQLNYKGDGKDFFKRFITLSLPTSARLLLIFYPLQLVTMLLLYRNVPDIDEFIPFVLSMLFEIAYLTLFFAYMRSLFIVAAGLKYESK